LHEEGAYCTCPCPYRYVACNSHAVIVAWLVVEMCKIELDHNGDIGRNYLGMRIDELADYKALANWCIFYQLLNKRRDYGIDCKTIDLGA
jgi:hypothetical protein